ncbi:serine kinase [Scheffersomyces xylosifermentans]|uniref:serine kinase n=1 Tax=Scheffersomyces xylosifermentans TaxID=1304137 RepID=UPI00315CB7D3
MLLINRENTAASSTAAHQAVPDSSATANGSSSSLQQQQAPALPTAPASTTVSSLTSSTSPTHRNSDPNKKLITKLNFSGLFKRLGSNNHSNTTTNSATGSNNLSTVNTNSSTAPTVIGTTLSTTTSHSHDTHNNISNDHYNYRTTRESHDIVGSPDFLEIAPKDSTLILTKPSGSSNGSSTKSTPTSISSSTTVTDEYNEPTHIKGQTALNSIIDDANHITIIPSNEDDDLLDEEYEEEDIENPTESADHTHNRKGLSTTSSLTASSTNMASSNYSNDSNIPHDSTSVNNHGTNQIPNLITSTTTDTVGAENPSNLNSPTTPSSAFLTPDYNYSHLNNDHERYTSFTAECISLQNSEMTSHLDVDSESQSMIINTIGSPTSPVGSPTFSRLHGDPYGDTSIYGMATASTATNSKAHHPGTPQISSPTQEPAPKHEVDSEIDDFDEYGDNDPTAYLSESESDINFDPKNEENEFEYKVGGYHPVTKGEIYYSKNFPQREYIILRKLGWGHFSTVWLAKSHYNPNLVNISENSTALVDTSEYYVAIKFVKSNKNYLEAAEDEIKILKTLSDPLTYGKHLSNRDKEYFSTSVPNPQAHPGYSHVMTLIDDFEIIGPHGNHICMVFEILGENVLNLIYKYKQFYNSVNSEIKKKSDGPRIHEEKPHDSSSSSNNILFSKWDTKIFSKKKNSKSMLKHVESSFSGDSDDDLDKKIKNMNSESLMKLIEKSKQLSGIPLNLVRQIVKQIFLAMDYMHHCGVIHTDLKPENILIQIKDIDKLIKTIENEKVAKYNSAKCSRKSSLFRKNSPCSAPKLQKKHTSTSLCNTPRNQSMASNNSIVSNSYYYKKSRNSIMGKYDSPIRSSKPLCCSISSDIIFKDIEYEEDPNKSSSHKRAQSLPKTIKKACAPSCNGAASIVSSTASEEISEPEISIKIADLGNATFTHHHFTNQIQTRQYRSPEIILKYKTWGSSTDMWSIGCIIFELITGDYLFDPHDGKYFDKDEDHLAQIVELLGEFPSDEYLIDCKMTSKFFKLDPKTNQIIFKNIDSLKFWGLEEVLVEKYKFKKDDIQVKLISDLILKCLRYGLDDRYDCHSLINHPWLKDDADFSDVTAMQVPIEEELNNLPNIHDDIPGYTCVCRDDNEEDE